MHRAAPRLFRTRGLSRCLEPAFARYYRVSSPSPTAQVQNAVTEPLQESRKRTWAPLAGIGLLITGGIGAGLWITASDQSLGSPQDVFQHYELLKNKRISNTSNILTIQPSTFGSRAYKSSLDSQHVAEVSAKGIWSVQIKHPLLTIARLYTPLPPFLSDPNEPTAQEKFAYVSNNPEENQLRFLIRNNPEGELSKYLSRTQAGGRLELRGPYQEYELPSEVEQIVFLVGGTGISPAIQLTHTLHERNFSGPKPSISILWANRRTDDCLGGTIAPPPIPDNFLSRTWGALFGVESPQPAVVEAGQAESPIVKELSTLQERYKGRLEVIYFADDQQRFIIKQDIQKKLHNPAPTTNDPKSEASGKGLVLVSGPDGFVEHYAGPKVWKEGKELQGPLGGLLHMMDLGEWKVWKL